MLTEPTIDKLHGLRLGAMAAAWTAQREDPKMNEIDFDGRFGSVAGVLRAAVAVKDQASCRSSLARMVQTPGA